MCPLEFPTVLIQYIYAPADPNNQPVLFCDEIPLHVSFQNKSSGIVGMRWEPPIRPGCEVTVYITPWKHCQSWRIEIPTRGPYSHFQKIFPSSHSYFSVGSQFQQEMLNLTGLSTARFFVLVGTEMSLKLPVGNNLLNFGDIYTTYRNEVPQLHTKVLLKVEQNYTVSAHVVTNEPISKGFRDAMRVCAGGKRKLTMQEQICVLQQRKLLVTYDYLTWEPNSVKSWKQLQDLSKSAGLATSNFVFTVVCQSCNPRFHPFEGKWKSQIEFIAGIPFFNASVSTKNILLHFGSPRILITINVWQLQMAQLETKGFYFVTCAKPDEVVGLSASGLYSQFQPALWLFLLMSIGITGLVTFWAQFLFFDKKFNNLGFTLQLLLEQSVQLPKRKCTSLFFAWILVTVVVSNSYKGDNITSVTAPRAEQKLERFSQLVERNFLYYSIFPVLNIVAELNSMVSNLPQFNNMSNIEESPSFTKCGNSSPVCIQHSVFKLTYLKGRTSANQSLVGILSANSMVHIVNSKEALLALRKLENLRDSTLSVISRCHREAYLGSFEDSNRFYMQLRTLLRDKQSDVDKRNYEMASISKESLGRTSVFWKFIEFPVEPSALTIRVHSCLASGILAFFDDWSLRMSTWNDTVKFARIPKKETPFSLRGNGVVIFYMLLALMLVAVMCFVMEQISNCSGYICGLIQPKGSGTIVEHFNTLN